MAQPASLIDGYHVFEKVASNLNLGAIPIIVSSAMDELESVVRCKEIDAEDYMINFVSARQKS